MPAATSCNCCIDKTMRWTPRILATFGIIAGVIGAILFVSWLGFREPGQPGQSGIQPSGASVSRPAQVSNAGASNGGSRSNVPDADVASAAAIAAATPADPNLITNWDDRIDDVLRDDSEIPAKARKLLEIFPHLPEPGQVEAAQHISNLLDNQDYPLFGRYLADPKTAPAVLDVLMIDILNRPNAAKMPLLLDVARNPDHSKAGEAKELLQLYLEEDYGTNWNTWQTKLDEWLKNNPD